MSNNLVQRLRYEDTTCADYPTQWEAADRIQELETALRKLVDACAYVSPIVGAVATKPSVKHIRNAGKFIEAVDNARLVLGVNK